MTGRHRDSVTAPGGGSGHRRGTPLRRQARSQGAIAAWERLLGSVPDYADTGKVRTMIAELKIRVS